MVYKHMKNGKFDFFLHETCLKWKWARLPLETNSLMNEDANFINKTLGKKKNSLLDQDNIGNQRSTWSSGVCWPWAFVIRVYLNLFVFESPSDDWCGVRWIIYRYKGFNCTFCYIISMLLSFIKNTIRVVANMYSPFSIAMYLLIVFVFILVLLVIYISSFTLEVMTQYFLWQVYSMNVKRIGRGWG